MTTSLAGVYNPSNLDGLYHFIALIITTRLISHPFFSSLSVVGFLNMLYAVVNITRFYIISNPREPHEKFGSSRSLHISAFFEAFSHHAFEFISSAHLRSSPTWRYLLLFSIQLFLGRRKWVLYLLQDVGNNHFSMSWSTQSR